jgi:hypothetical protein
MWRQNFHPTHRAKPEMRRGAKSKMNLAEGPFFETLSSNAHSEHDPGPATKRFCYHVFTRFQGEWGNRRRICGVQPSERHSRG